jgi:polar amino acid transport system permease protein
MSSSGTDRPAERSGAAPDGAPRSHGRSNRPATSTDPDDQAEAIQAIRLRHPWRNIFAGILVVALVLFVLDAAQRPAFGWDNFAKYIFDQRISQAALNTVLLTIYSMAIAIVLGITLAVMRLSTNPVVRGIAWLYLWIFRGTPVYVQLVFWGLFATIYSTIDIGIPFLDPWITWETADVIDVFWLAVIGLALNESAYMAEIVRAGILSVDKGQDEAATALGMSWLQTMRRVVIPQAMRIIIPPTGNEVISMLKTTSLVTALGFSLELYARTRAISAQIYATVPLLIVASIWYLLVTSILMVGQHYLEKYYGRGVAPQRAPENDPEVEAVLTAADPTAGAAGNNAEAVPPPKREHQ